MCCVAVLLVAACGSSSSTNNAADNATAASSPTAQATGSTLSFGIECSCSGAFAEIAVNESILDAWADYTNAHGGIDGHAVKFTAEDDALNPGTSLAQVTRLVEQDHVIAIIDLSDVDSAWATFVQQHKVPVIGWNLTSTLMYSNPDFFPEGQTIDTAPQSIAAAAQKEGVTKLGVMYCSGAAVCKQLASPVERDATALGITAKFTEALNDSAPSYTAPCLAAEQAGVTGIFVADAEHVVSALASACAAQGYNPKYLILGTAVGPSTTKINGIVAVESNVPAGVTQTSAAVQTMTDLIKTYEPSVLTNAAYGPAATSAWATGVLLAAAVQAGHVGDDPTSAEMLNGLCSLHADTLDGLAPPLTYKEGQPTSVACWFYLGVNNQAFDLPYGPQSYCVK